MNLGKIDILSLWCCIPDDVEIGMGGTIAKYTEKGIRKQLYVI